MADGGGFGHYAPDALAAALAAATTAALGGFVVTFGMQPDRPETGYGYIEVGEVLAGAPGVHRVARFVKKPDAAAAGRLIADGRHCGIPAWSCSPRRRWLLE